MRRPRASSCQPSVLQRSTPRVPPTPLSLPSMPPRRLCQTRSPEAAAAARGTYSAVTAGSHAFTPGCTQQHWSAVCERERMAVLCGLFAHTQCAHGVPHDVADWCCTIVDWVVLCQTVPAEFLGFQICLDSTLNPTVRLSESVKCPSCCWPVKAPPTAVVTGVEPQTCGPGWRDARALHTHTRLCDTPITTHPQARDQGQTVPARAPVSTAASAGPNRSTQQRP